MEPIIDPQYVSRVETRVSFLQQKSGQVGERVSASERHVEMSSKRIERDIVELSNELDDLEHATHLMVKRVTKTLEKFHTVVKQGDLKRMQKKVDVWAPEKKISRVMFQRMMQEK